MANPPETPGTWYWDRGVSHFTVRYDILNHTDPGAENSDTLTWLEEIAPEDDDRGYGSHLTSTQTRTEFLLKGPHSAPPVAIIEALLTHFQAQKPSWFDIYRLLIAARAQDMTAVRELLAAGVPADTPFNGSTPIYEAVSGHNLALAKMFFGSGVDVNRQFPGSKETILMTLATWAPDDTWEPLAARMVAQRMDLEARNNWGETALMFAANAGSRLPWLTPLLLQAGANVNARSTHGYTALMKSVMRFYAPVTITEQLLEAGADVNARDDQGWSALMWAISNSLAEGVRCLLAAGADVHVVSTPTQKYRDPKSVLQLALDYANPEIIALVRGALETR